MRPDERQRLEPLNFVGYASWGALHCRTDVIAHTSGYRGSVVDADVPLRNMDLPMLELRYTWPAAAPASLPHHLPRVCDVTLLKTQRKGESARQDFLELVKLVCTTRAQSGRLYMRHHLPSQEHIERYV